MTPAGEPGAYAHLLAPGRIGSLALRNRIVLTPMGTNLEAQDGTPGERITRFYEERARGGVGLVVVGVTGIDWPAGVSNPRNMGLSDDRFVAPFRELTDRIHAQGAAIAVQLQHAGRVALEDVAAGRPRLAPSALPDSAGDLMRGLTPQEIGALAEPFTREGADASYRELDEADIERLVARFAEAAERARRAGFDGVELHAGHGYLLSSFLSPSTNHRRDAWGGPLEGRARLLLETIRRVRARVGPDYPVWCRLDAVELHKQDGISPEDARRTAEWAVAAGLDALHVSAYADPRRGIAFTDAPLPHTPGAYVELAAAIKRRVPVPVIAVGRIEPEQAEAILRDGRADFVAMGRRLLADPELPRKLAGASAAAARPCIYSYRCVGNVFLRRHATCSVNPALSRGPEGETSPAPARRHVLVAGGGPAGLDVARRLLLRGHRVTLLERAPRLGGLALAAGAAQESNAPLVGWLEGEVRRLGAELRLACEATAASVLALAPDAVVVAIGAGAARATLPGADGVHVVERSALGDDPAPLLARGPRVAVVGGDLVGVSLALWLAGHGAHASLLEEGPLLATEMAPPRRWRALHALAESKVETVHGARVIAVEGAGVLYREGEQREQRLAADTVVLARAPANGSPLAAELAARGLEVTSIGDCTGPRYLEGCFLDAWRTANAL